MATSYLETTLYRKCIVKLNRGEIERIQVVGRSLVFKRLDPGIDIFYFFFCIFVILLRLGSDPPVGGT